MQLQVQTCRRIRAGMWKVRDNVATGAKIGGMRLIVVAGRVWNRAFFWGRLSLGAAYWVGAVKTRHRGKPYAATGLSIMFKTGGNRGETGQFAGLLGHVDQGSDRSCPGPGPSTRAAIARAFCGRKYGVCTQFLGWRPCEARSLPRVLRAIRWRPGSLCPICAETVWCSKQFHVPPRRLLDHQAVQRACAGHVLDQPASTHRATSFVPQAAR